MAGHLSWAFLPPSVHHTRSPILYWGTEGEGSGCSLVADMSLFAQRSDRKIKFVVCVCMWCVCVCVCVCVHEYGVC